MSKNQPLKTSFELYSKWLDLSFQTAKLLNASSQVIYYRSKMMQQAMQGKILWTHPEFSKLWQEKITANLEANASIMQSTWQHYLNSAKTTPEQQAIAGVKAITKAAQSYEKRASANAKRLKKN